MFRVLLASLILTWSNAFAQSFFFISSRIQVEGDLSRAEPWERKQNEVFIYRNGSEIRFTNTNNLSEYDLSISPDGSLVAYAATSWVYPNQLEESSWQIFVKDLRGRLPAQFAIPNSQESMRPAGGYLLAWKADSSGFYFNAEQAGSEAWDIYFYDLKTKTSKRITEGFMPFLSPDNKLLATNVDELVRVYDIDLDESWTVFEGSPLAWYDDSRLFVQNGSSLFLLDVYKPNREKLIHDANAYYIQMDMNKDLQYAFIVQRDSGSSLYKFVNEEELLAKDFSGFIREIALQEDGSIIYSIQEDDSIKIYKIDDSGNITPLVSSFGDDFSPTVIKK